MRSRRAAKSFWRGVAAAALVLAFALPLHAASVEVATVVDGTTLTLEDGRAVRLAAILAPDPPLGWKGDAWRLAAAARTALSELALGHGIELRGGVTDRYGRVAAQIYREDGLWLQGEMLRRGLARTSADGGVERDRVIEMLALEAAAREARLGLWRDPFYRVRSPDEAGNSIETFQLVEGRIADAAKVKGQVFLNFGPDWRAAFTIRLPHPALAAFKELGLDPLALKGRLVRIRGWIRLDRRPMIDAARPELIELLD
jgi:endonuclease YncB( thermonuclease family)